MAWRVKPGPSEYDAVIVGSGPNGLAAAITIARTGRRVLVLESRDAIGGGLATAELTLPGFRHDVFSAVHPFGVASPFFRELPLRDHGLSWVVPDAPFAHPLDDGPAVVAEASLQATAADLAGDSSRYRMLMAPVLERWDEIASDILRPLVAVPRHPLALARFGIRALPPARLLADTLFRTTRARALLGGLAAHANMPLGSVATSAPMLVLAAMAHRVNWPFPRGGAASLAAALAAYLRTLGGEIVTGAEVRSPSDLPPAGAYLLDVAPRRFLDFAGPDLPAWYRWWLERYRPGPGVFKIDLALDGPIPWRDDRVARAGTVHLGATIEEIAASESAVARGRVEDRPFVLLAQQSLFDASRAPTGKHTAWAYCHVPGGSDVDMTARVLDQIERFAPGVRDRVLAMHVSKPADLARRNANLIGGDPGGGAQTLLQTVARPVPTPDPYATPLEHVYLCSASTPPGPGVHGMCGHNAANSALRRSFGVLSPRFPRPTARA